MKKLETKELTIQQLLDYIDNLLMEQDMRIESINAELTALKRKLLFGENSGLL